MRPAGGVFRDARRAIRYAKRVIPSLAAFALGAQAAAAREPARSLPTVGIVAAIQRTMSAHGVPGLSAAVVVDGEPPWSEGFGLADVENRVPARASTVYRLASVTKPITATAVLQLTEQGALELDVPIRRYLPDLPVQRWPITARQLLCHQGGVRNWTPAEFENTRHFATVQEAVAVFWGDPLVYEPGTRELYSSFGYTLLGRLVEVASGLGYPEYLRRNVFEPAGMRAAQVDDVHTVIPNRAAGYERRRGGRLARSIPSDTSNRLPAGGLIASAEDVARFGAALLNGGLLRPGSVEKMLTRQTLRHGGTTRFGLGLSVERSYARREAFHLGGQPQVSTILYMRPERRLVVVLLCNLESMGGPLTGLAREIADILEGDL